MAKKTLCVILSVVQICAVAALCAVGAFAADEELQLTEHALTGPSLYQNNEPNHPLTYSLLTYWGTDAYYSRFGLNELDGFGFYLRSSGVSYPVESSYSHYGITQIPYSEWYNHQSSYLRYYVYQSDLAQTEEFIEDNDQYLILADYTSLHNRGCNFAVALPHLIYDSIPIPLDLENRVFKMSYSFDFFMNEEREGYNVLSSAIDSALVPMMRFHSGGSGQIFVPASTVIKTQTASNSWNLTVYWDLNGSYINELISGEYLYMQPIITYPVLLRVNSGTTKQATFAYCSFPSTYTTMDGPEYEEDMDAMIGKLDEIQASLSQQTSVITGKLQDIIDQERDETNQEYENAAQQGGETAEEVFNVTAYKNALEQLTSLFTYQGTDFSFKLPSSGEVPFIGHLWDEQDIPFKQMIDSLPVSILYVMRFLAWLGLAFSFVYLVKSMIKDLNGGDS